MVIFQSIPFGVLPFGNRFGKSEVMSESPPVHSAAVLNRRRQLRRWIDEHFDGSQTAFVASTADGEKQINQGELSGLLKEKSFGEKRARSLEAQAGMPPGYLDSSDSSEGNAPTHVSEPKSSAGNVVAVQAMKWPFHNVTYQRLMTLKAALGPRVGHEALRDIDALLDVAVGKWERLAQQKKKRG